jgi:hypothetical protein
VLTTLLTFSSMGALAIAGVSGAPDPAPFSFNEIAQLAASDPEAGDEFGLAVAIDGDTIVVGAWRGDDACSSNPDCNSGAAYVYYRNQGGADSWGFVKKLTASDAALNDSFGYTVAVSGDYIVVGAPAISNYSVYGAAYIYERDRDGADNWGERIKLQPKDPGANDKFGISVSISGSLVLVGAPYNDDSGSATGAAYLFERDYHDPDPWSQRKKFTAQFADRWQGDWFGYSVAISSDTAIIGVPNEDGGAGNLLQDAGRAHIFQQNVDGANMWGEVTQVVASDAEAQDQFGLSVAISGDTAVVGANYNDDACPADINCNSGSAYVYERAQGGADNWGQVRKLTASDHANGDEFGISVGISGDSIVVGARWADAVGVDSGAAYLFSRDQGGPDKWGQLQRFVGSSTTAGDETGRAVGASGQIAVVGAPFDDTSATDAGSAYVCTVPVPALSFFIGDPPAEQ